MPTISGIATRINKRNAIGDLFLPGAFNDFISQWEAGRTPKVNLLNSHRGRHDAREIVGEITKLSANNMRLSFDADVETGTLAGREIFTLAINKRVDRLSAGYMPVEYKTVEKGWDIEIAHLWEVSIVMRGADPGARITAVKE